MISALAATAEDRWFSRLSPDRVIPKTIKLVFIASRLSNLAALRTKGKDSES